MVAILIACHCWLSTVTAATDADATGDSSYNRMVEMSLRGEHQQLGKEKDKALLFFQQHQQWEHYYYIASLCTMSKVMHEGQTMAGLRECRRLYEFARNHHHDLGRGIVMTQIGWLYSYIGDHEEGVRQMQEAFRLLLRHPLRRENILALYHYAYALELTGKYDEEAARGEAEFQKKFVDFLQGQKDFPQTIMQKRQAELQTLMDNGVAFRVQVQTLLAQAEKDLVAEVQKKLNRILLEIGVEYGYGFILNTDDNACPYINPVVGVDVTDLVRRKLGTATPSPDEQNE
jgi:outer membrane protein